MMTASTDFTSALQDAVVTGSEDITSFKERERELDRLSRLYEALSQISHAIVSTPVREDLLRATCRALVEKGGLFTCWVGWHSADTETLELVAACGDATDYLRGLRATPDGAPGRDGPAGTAFKEQRPFVCNDWMSEAAPLAGRDEAQRGGFRASAAFPIREGGEVRGVLSVYSREASYFSDREVSLLTGAMENLALGLDSITREEARQRAEAELRRERDFSDAVLRSSPGIFYLYDQEGRFLRWNRNFERVSGYDSAEIASMHPLDFFSAEDRAFISSRIESVFGDGQSTAQASFVTKDHRSIPYQFTGVRTEIGDRPCLLGVGIDVSQRVLAEAALFVSEARYRSLFERGPDGILVVDAAGNYVDANPSLCHMLGFPREVLLGRHVSEDILFDHPLEAGAALELIRTAGALGTELRFRRQDGTFFDASMLTTPLPDDHLLAALRDVTQRKVTEQTLRELNETLEQKVALRTEDLERALVRAEAADRLKSAFLATMSHELRTPLNSIIGFTGILLQGMAGPLTAEQSKQLGMVRGSGRHLLELINDVLDLSKIEAEQLKVRMEAFDLASLLERVVATVMPMAQKKGLSLALSTPSQLGELVSDRRRVEQILLNLTNNAIKFTGFGSVKVTAEPVESWRGARGAAPEPAVRISVEDTGVGLKAADLSKLFQPFSQIDTGLTRQHEGTGLGLTICRRLAELLGGEIEVASEWGRGSVFSVTLPRRPRTA
jgi:PAS domain S-box-containing protein